MRAMKRCWPTGVWALLCACCGCGDVSLPTPRQQGVKSTLSEEEVAGDLAVVADARAALRANEDGPWAVQTLFQAFDHEDARVRHKAILAMQELNSRTTSALPALVELSRSGPEEQRSRALAALGRLGPAAKEAAPELAQALNDEDPRVRAAAEAALSAIQKEIGGDFAGLVGALNDVDEDTRWQAARALGGAVLSRWQQEQPGSRRQ